MSPFLRIGPALAVAATALLGATAAQANGQTPDLAFSPSTNGSHDFGTIDAGQTVSQRVTLTNSGASASAALTIALSGSGAFTKTADTCTATSIGPLKSCSLSVAYAPTTPAQTDTATLTATGVRPAASTTLTLTGASAASGPIEFTFDGFFTVVDQLIDFDDPACPLALARWRIDATADIEAEPRHVDLDPAELHLDFCVNVGPFSDGTVTLRLPGGELTGDLNFAFYSPGGPTPGFTQELSLTFDITGGTGAFSGASGSVQFGATWIRPDPLSIGTVTGTVDVPGV